MQSALFLFNLFQGSYLAAYNKKYSFFGITLKTKSLSRCTLFIWSEDRSNSLRFRWRLLSTRSKYSGTK